MSETNMEQYNEYLQTRSRIGDIYRRFILFPRLNRILMGRVLDVGCGIGDFLDSRPGSYGIDINPLNVAYCRKRGFDAGLIESNQYPAKDHTFDSAIANHVIEHLLDPKPLLTEVKRVLKPNGMFVLGVPGKRGYDTDPDHKTYYELDSLTLALEANGFRVESHFYLPLPLLALTTVMKQFSLYVVAKSKDSIQ